MRARFKKKPGFGDRSIICRVETFIALRIERFETLAVPVCLAEFIAMAVTSQSGCLPDAAICRPGQPPPTISTTVFGLLFMRFLLELFGRAQRQNACRELPVQGIFHQ